MNLSIENGNEDRASDYLPAATNEAVSFEVLDTDFENPNDKSRDRQVAQTAFILNAIGDENIVNEEVTEPLESVNLDRFAELPSRRESLKGVDKNGVVMYLSFGIAKKLYRCLCCAGNIHIGSEHAILSHAEKLGGYNHHHVDFECVQSELLPKLSDIKIIKPKEATPTAMNKRARRARYNRRRNR